MSAALYFVRLMWLDGRGDMAARGLHVRLYTAPAVLAALGLAEVQFEPDLQVFWGREMFSGPRDLTTDEITRLRAWCDARAAAARVLIEQP